MRHLKLLISALLAIVVAGLGLGAAPANATGSGMFRASTVWHGQFGTPDVVRVGNTYWAYATTTGGDNLPIMHSTNLVKWVTRSPYPAGKNPGWWRGYNDGLPHPARWALYYIHRNGRSFASIWGPSVAWVHGHYVLTYAVSTGRPNRHCISVATSSSPRGPFVDSTRRPIVCSSDPGGSIDPQIIVDRGRAYLIWKNAGVKGSTPTRIWSQQLTWSGTALAAGSRPHNLLVTARPWEGNVIENPAMIHYAGRYYLFYSGNSFISPKYATGYAICAGPLGPCRRPSTPGPLLATRGPVVGPGSASPFVGRFGGLRLAYAAWDRGYSGPADPVKLHCALLTVDGRGYLHVKWAG